MIPLSQLMILFKNWNTIGKKQAKFVERRSKVKKVLQDCFESESHRYFKSIVSEERQSRLPPQKSSFYCN